MNIKKEVNRIKSESKILHNRIDGEVLKQSLKYVGDGDLFEFGVYHGYSIKAILNSTQGNKIYGFDSFTGLPEAWTGHREHEYPKGHFSRNGNPPDIKDDRVTFVKGFFNESLPIFIKSYSGEVGLIHVDCDLYSSTKTVLHYMKPFIKSGVVIVFDEFLDYPDFELHEIKAWLEFVEETGVTYKYLYSGREQVGLIIL